MKLRCLKICLCSVFQKIIYKCGMNVFKTIVLTVGFLSEFQTGKFDSKQQWLR